MQDQILVERFGEDVWTAFRQAHNTATNESHSGCSLPMWVELDPFFQSMFLSILLQDGVVDITIAVMHDLSRAQSAPQN